MVGSTPRRVDFDEIKRAALAALPDLLARWFPAGKENGHEFVVGDIHGNPGDSLKVNMDTGAWADFAGDDKGGDPIDLMAAIMGTQNMLEAAVEVASYVGVAVPEKFAGGERQQRAPVKPGATRQKARRPRIQYIAAHRVLRDGLSNQATLMRKLEWADQHWVYNDSHGRPLFWVRRKDRDEIDPKTGKRRKDFFPLAWCVLKDPETGEELTSYKEKPAPGWFALHLANNRPLYGLDRVAKHADKAVIWCEGEKAADAAYRLVGEKQAVITNMGGSKAFEVAKWSPIAGRTVIIWPDNDKAGLDARCRLTEILTGLDCTVKWIRTDDLAAKADAADLEMTPKEFRQWGKGRVTAPDPAVMALWASRSAVDAPEAAPPPPAEPAAPDGPPAAQEGDPGPSAADVGPDHRQQGDAHDPLDNLDSPIPLGYDRQDYYYYAPHKAQVIKLTDREHNEAGLTSIASMARYWEHSPFRDKRGIDWKAASAWYRDACVEQGVFDDDVIRGRGAWLDRGRRVVHLGHAMVVDGLWTELHQFDTEYVYERAKAMPYEPATPATDAEAQKLLQIARSFRWDRDLDGTLLAGSVMVSYVCGALRWRPSVWITGPSGSGKSTVMDLVVTPLLEGYAVKASSTSTEAGLRQTIKRDGRPVLFDEAESEGDRKDQERLRSILQLVRASSSEAGAGILKGTTGGDAQEYKIRSTFIFSSINVSIKERADESRVTRLKLFIPFFSKADEEERVIAEQRFSELQDYIAHTITDEYRAKMLARAVDLMDVIRHNAEVFSYAFTIEMGNKRAGDQVGALLAGAYACHSREKVDRDAARAWIRQHDWSEKTVADDDDDAVRCLRFLTECMVKDGHRERLLGEVLNRARQNDQDAYNDRRFLLTQGIKYLNAAEVQKFYAKGTEWEPEHGPGFVFLSSHAAIKRLLAGQPWVTSYPERLAEIDGALRMVSGRKLSVNGQKYRGTLLPITALFPEDHDEPPGDLEPDPTMM